MKQHALSLSLLLSCVALVAIGGCSTSSPSPVDGGGTDARVPDGATSDAHDLHDANVRVDGGDQPDAYVPPDAWSGCASSTECDDGNPCNGTETCASGTCTAGTPLTCTPRDACHTASCNPASGCVETLVDADGDGYASSSLGGCGVDCNDASADIHPGATEIPGDLIDEDCNGTELCYDDTDRDGYRATTVSASTDLMCLAVRHQAPASAGIDCLDTYALVYPGATEVVGNDFDDDCDGHELCYADTDGDGSRSDGVVTSPDTTCAHAGQLGRDATSDCCDADGRVHPGQTDWYTGSSGGSACGGWDFECDGSELRQYGSTYNCYTQAGSVPTCYQASLGWRNGVPACGTSGSWVTSCTGTGSCNLGTTSQEQACH